MADNAVISDLKRSGWKEEDRGRYLSMYQEEMAAGLTRQEEERLFGESFVDAGYAADMRETIDSIEDPRQRKSAALLLRTYEREGGRADEERKNQVLLARVEARAAEISDSAGEDTISGMAQRLSGRSRRRARTAQEKAKQAKELLDQIAEKDEKGKVKPMYTEFEQYQLAMRSRMAAVYVSVQMRQMIEAFREEEERGPVPEDTSEELENDEDEPELPGLEENEVTHAKTARFEIDDELDAEAFAQAAGTGALSGLDEEQQKKGKELFGSFFGRHFPKQQQEELKKANLDIFDTIYIGGMTARECFESKYADETPERREAMMKCEIVAALLSVREHVSFSRMESTADGPMLSSPVDIRPGLKNRDSKLAGALEEFYAGESAADYQVRMTGLDEAYARNVQKMFDLQAAELGLDMTGVDMQRTYERLHEERNMQPQREEIREERKEEEKKEMNKESDRERTSYRELVEEEMRETGRKAPARTAPVRSREQTRTLDKSRPDQMEKKSPFTEMTPRGMSR